MKNRSTYQAFTLIELLVVIAIIAILAAILFPVFAQAKMAAKKTVDLSNLKQLGTSVYIYNNDYDDMNPTLRNLPFWGGCTSPSDPSGATESNCHQSDSIVAQLEPYVKNHPIWGSPGDPTQHCDGSPSSEPGGCTIAVTGGPVSYTPTFNAAQSVINPVPGWDASETYGVFGIPDAAAYFGTPGCNSLTTSQLSSPSGLIMFAPMFITWSYYSGFVQWRNDQREFAFNPTVWPAGGIPDAPAAPICPYCWCCPGDTLEMESFNGQANWLFADSHAKSMARSATMSTQWINNPSLAISSFAKNLFDANPGYN